MFNKMSAAKPLKRLHQEREILELLKELRDAAEMEIFHSSRETKVSH